MGWLRCILSFTLLRSAACNHVHLWHKIIPTSSLDWFQWEHGFHWPSHLWGNGSPSLTYLSCKSPYYCIHPIVMLNYNIVLVVFLYSVSMVGYARLLYPISLTSFTTQSRSVMSSSRVGELDRGHNEKFITVGIIRKYCFRWNSVRRI
jgi:hypothetical protein